VTAEVDRASGNVQTAALRQVPTSFILCAWDPANDMERDGKHTYYRQDRCAAFTRDFDNGQRRRSPKDDIANMARIAEVLEPVDTVAPAVSAEDIPKAAVVVRELQAFP
jgi:trimethylamine:corrinoid methyltransferase-like protein